MNKKLCLEHISKSYGTLEVLKDFSAELSGPGIYCLMAPSGAGKTTLFRLILNLEQPDSGHISYFEYSGHSECSNRFEQPGHSIRFSAVFQEDRLIQHLSPIANAALGLPGKADKAAIRKELLSLLPEESLTRPIHTLSGGMKRRCAFLRAMLAPSDIVIMDEPFTGLDEKTKDSVIHYLLDHQNDRLFIIATHDPDDVKKLGAITIKYNLPSSE